MANVADVLPERVAQHVEVGVDGCWRWTRALNGAGYGVAWWDAKLWRTHRLAWIGAGRELIDGMVLDHLCRNRDCCNPDHLRQVTRGENVLADGSLSNAARRKAQTHCLRGHELSGDNVRLYRNKRECKACVAIRDASRKPGRRCLDCGAEANGTRCRPCYAKYRSRYGARWREISMAQRASEPQCRWCGSTGDLTADHIVPGELSGGLQTLCRSCNARRRHGATA